MGNDSVSSRAREDRSDRGEGAAAGAASGGVEPPNVPEQRPGKLGGKRDRNRRERTQQLLDAALEVFLARGIEAVTIDEIVNVAGLSKGSFYRYFDGKRQVVETLMGPLRERLDEAIGSCRAALSTAQREAELFGAYQALALGLAGLLVTARDPLRLYLQEARGPAVGDRGPVRELADDVARAAVELTEVARTRGLLRPVDPRVSALAVIGAGERLLFEAMAEDAPMDPLVASAALIGLVLDGVRAR